MSENWKDIKDFESKYQVSDLGNFRSKTRKVKTATGERLLKGKVLKKQTKKDGYQIIGLSFEGSVKSFQVHQMVLATFNPSFNRGQQVNHIDGDKLNNSLTNLEPSNPSHNQLHAVRAGLKAKQGKSQYRNVTYVKNPKAIKKWAASIRHNGKSSYGWKTFETEIEAAMHVDSILDSIGDMERSRNFPLNVQRPTCGKV